ncbi:MAG: hypothetical protein SVJ22_07315 [Halobacteriota archaeon]|nr:hypothetical protein [Halobacteriota archaeon]
MAEFEVPEGAITFESLGISGTYDDNATKSQTKEVTLHFSHPNEVKIVFYTFRDYSDFETKIYVNELLATQHGIGSGNKETTMTIPGAFIDSGENTIYIEFIDGIYPEKFSKSPLSIAPKSYILAVDPSGGGGATITQTTPSSSETPTPTASPPKPSEKTPTPTQTQTDVKGVSIKDIQKSSETSPDIKIEAIEDSDLVNGNVLLSGSASSDAGIKSVTINGNYVGTEYWNMPINLSLGENNVVIVATDNEGNTTIGEIEVTAAAPESESEQYPPGSSDYLPIVGILVPIVCVFLAWYLRKKWS